MNYEQYSVEDFATDESFIAYYLQTDKDAIVFWQNWIVLHPEKLDEISQAELLLAKLNLELNESELEIAFDQFGDFLHQDSIKEPLTLPIRKPFPYQKIAVAATVLIVSSFFVVQYYRKQAAKPAIYLSYHNDYGKTSTLILSDGSKISLNSNSTLKYPKKFSGNTREVELDGEGFFEITKDKEKPFIVKTKKLNTRVLGTKFNISAYSNFSNIAVALLEGSVAVELANKQQSIVLRPSEMAMLKSTKNTLEKSTFNKAGVLDWQTGTVSFENAAFDDIAAKLYNVYGVTLINKTDQSDWRYTGRFQKTDYISVIKNICFAKRINYQVNGKTITLTK